MSTSRKLLKASITMAVLAGTAPALEIPTIAPQVSSIFPHGGRKGSSVEIEMRGTYLNKATSLRFPDGSLGAEILSSKFHLVRVRVQIPADAETGRHDFRLVGENGAWFGVFWIGTEPETQEKEPNDLPAAAETITAPVVINGQADGADADYFRFHAEPGDTFIFDVNAVRSGSSLDPVLTLLDPTGREIDYCDDYYTSKDAQIVHTFSKAGDYFIRVTASFERSARDAEYRLLITKGAHAAYSLPLGGTRGQKTEIRVTGFNLDLLDHAWLDRTPAQSQRLSRTRNEVRFRVTVPESLQVGTHNLHFSADGRELSLPLRFEVSDLPEICVTDGDAPLPIQPPLIVNGSNWVSP